MILSMQSPHYHLTEWSCQCSTHTVSLIYHDTKEIEGGISIVENTGFFTGAHLTSDIGMEIIKHTVTQ